MKKRNKINLSKKSKYRIISMIILSILLLNYTAFAVLKDDLKNKNNEIENAKSEKKQVQNSLSKNLKAIQNVEAEIERNNTQIQELEKQQEEIKKTVETQKVELEQLKSKIGELKKEAEQRLVTMYQNGYTTTWELLLNSDNIIDFLSTYYLLQEVSKMDMEILNKTTDDSAKIEAIESELKTKTKLIAENQKSIEDAKKRNEALKIQKEEESKKLSVEEQEIQAKIQKFESEKRIIEAQIQAEIRAAMKQNLSKRKYVGGRMLWPVPSTERITAYYAESWKTGYPGSFHTGIDIGVAYNTVVAANDGKVISAIYNPSRGYGNYIIIDHGGGITTLYGHGSKFLVNSGDYVVKGQPIMVSGNSGYSTGPHLHFEVRVSGNHTDPLPYLR